MEQQYVHNIFHFIDLRSHCPPLTDGWGFLLSFTAPMWTLTGYDSAAHISEETSGAARAAPIAILVGVAGTASLGWLILIAASFATTSVDNLLTTTLPLQMGQLFLDTLGKRGMLAIWSFIIVVQVHTFDSHRAISQIPSFHHLFGFIWLSYRRLTIARSLQFVTGAAQGVDASRVVYAFARDNALPGSRYWKKVNGYTQTPVNAVWLVMFVAGICGLLGFSEAALSSLAGYVYPPPPLTRYTNYADRSAVIGLYLSYVTPVFLRITSGRGKLVPGPFSLGRWGIPIGTVACSWVTFICILLLFPGFQDPTAQTMSTYSFPIYTVFNETDASTDYAVVIIMFVFLFAGGWWLVSARHWFTGPVKTVETNSELSSQLAEKQDSTDS